MAVLASLALVSVLLRGARSLACAPHGVGVGCVSSPASAPQVADVLHLELDVAFDLSSRRASGRVTHHLRAFEPTVSVVWLHAESTVDVRSARDGSGRSLAYEQAEGMLRVEWGQPMGGEPVELHLEFTSSPSRGLYFGGNDGRGGATSVVSVGEVDQHRHWFPLWDHPSERLTSRVCLRGAGSSMRLASGVQEGEGDGERDNGERRCFRSEVAHPPHVLAVAVGPWSCQALPGGSVRGLLCGPPGVVPLAPPAARELGELPDLLAELVGAPFPYPTVTHLVVDELPVVGIEHAALPTYARAAWWDGGPRGDADRVALAAHELAHQWFGVEAAVGRWEDAWLQEGLATWLEHKALRALRGNARAQERWELLMAWADRRDGSLRLGQDLEGADPFDAASYGKAAAAVMALEDVAGAEAIGRGVLELLQRGQERPLEATDWFGVAREVGGAAFVDWTTRALAERHVPRCRVEARPAEDGQGLLVRWRPSRDCPTAPLHLDVVVHVGGMPPHVRRLDTVGAALWVQGAVEAIELDPATRAFARWDMEQSPPAWRKILRWGTTAAMRVRAAEVLGAAAADPTTMRAFRDVIARADEVPWVKEAAAIALARWAEEGDARARAAVAAAAFSADERVRAVVHGALPARL